MTERCHTQEIILTLGKLKEVKYSYRRKIQICEKCYQGNIDFINNSNNIYLNSITETECVKCFCQRFKAQLQLLRLNVYFLKKKKEKRNQYLNIFFKILNPYLFKVSFS